MPPTSWWAAVGVEDTSVEARRQAGGAHRPHHEVVGGAGLEAGHHVGASGDRGSAVGRGEALPARNRWPRRRCSSGHRGARRWTLGGDQVTRDEPCPMPARTAVGGPGGVSADAGAVVCARALAMMAATMGDTAGVAAGAGATGLAARGVGGHPDRRRRGRGRDRGGRGRVGLGPGPGLAWPRCGVVLPGGVAEPAGGDVTVVDVEAPATGPVAPTVGAVVEAVERRGATGTNRTRTSRMPRGGRPPRWPPSSPGPANPGAASAAPTATTTRATRWHRGWPRARLSGSGASPTNHRSHCFKP